METLARSGDLHALEQRLQHQLQWASSESVQFHVRCVLKNEKLMVLAQHPSEAFPEIGRTFAILKQALQTFYPFSNRSIHLYMRVAGHKRPYASQTFISQVSVSMATDRAVDRQYDNNENAQVEIPSGIDSEPIEISQIPMVSTPQNSDFGNESPPIATNQPEPSGEHPDRSRPWRWRDRWIVPVAGASAGIAILVAGGYALTRPCVIGRCEAIAEARQTNRSALQNLEADKSTQTLNAARSELAQSRDRLDAIPPWSLHHSQAQSLLETNQKWATMLDRAAVALSKAGLAAQKAQNPPHTVAEWQEIRALWQEAIDRLQEVPEVSPAYGLAQEKLKQYRRNRQAIDRRLELEQEGQKQLNAAESAAQIARARQSVADDLGSWRLVHATWQTAMNALQRIPEGTVAHQEAQQRFLEYEPHLATARERRSQEQISVNTYNQALRVADRAKNFEQKGQWGDAMSHWRTALTLVQQVPKGTAYHKQAQPLVDTFATALDRAATLQKTAIAIQSARNDLNRTCAGSPVICTANVSSDVIKIRLTPGYVQQVRQTASAAQTSGDRQTSFRLQDHVRGLIEAFKTISNNTEIPIEVYDPKGNRIGAYAPRT